MKEPYIIAEIGSNCFKYSSLSQNLDCAKEQIALAKKSGADAVKFQFFKAADLWGPNCEGKTFAVIQDKYAMPEGWLPELEREAKRCKIDFLCSAFSVQGFTIVDEHVPYHKVASPEFRARDIMDWCKGQRKPVIYSLGCPNHHNAPEFHPHMIDVILECVSAYPADPLHYDLFSAKQKAEEWKCRWGVSDHTKGTMLARLARSLGASVFEKHVDFTVYGGKRTPDADVSSTGEQFRMYVNDIRKQEVVNHKNHKTLAARLYGRRKTSYGYYRPWPEGAPGVE